MKKAILVFITIASIILLFGYYNLMHRDNTNFEGDSTFIYINSSDSIVSILDTINKKIKSPKTFLKAAKRMDYIENIKSGRFNILKGAGNKEIINSLKFNNTPLTVTFNNQERIHDLAGRVSKQILADSVSLLNAFLEKSFLEDNALMRRILCQFIFQTLMSSSGMWNQISLEIECLKSIMIFGMKTGLKKQNQLICLKKK